MKRVAIMSILLITLSPIIYADNAPIDNQPAIVFDRPIFSSGFISGSEILIHGNYGLGIPCAQDSLTHRDPPPDPNGAAHPKWWRRATIRDLFSKALKWFIE